MSVYLPKVPTADSFAAAGISPGRARAIEQYAVARQLLPVANVILGNMNGYDDPPEIPDYRITKCVGPTVYMDIFSAFDQKWHKRVTKRPHLAEVFKGELKLTLEDDSIEPDDFEAIRSRILDRMEGGFYSFGEVELDGDTLEVLDGRTFKLTAKPNSGRWYGEVILKYGQRADPTVEIVGSDTWMQDLFSWDDEAFESLQLTVNGQVYSQTWDDGTRISSISSILYAVYDLDRFEDLFSYSVDSGETRNVVIQNLSNAPLDLQLIGINGGETAYIFNIHLDPYQGLNDDEEM